MGAIKGQSKLRFINTYIWDQPWYVELGSNQKLAYFYIHTKCSDIGVYLHSERAMKNHLEYAYSIDEIVKWMNKRRKIVIKIDDDTLLLQWNLKELSKRGTKIKPISNPDLGKVREAIESKTLDHLIENGSFHVECKYFEFGISESIIENTVFSAKVKKGREHSDYEEMIIKVKSKIDKMEGLSKAFLNLIKGLPKPLQNVLIQNPSNSKAVDKTVISDTEQTVYQEIARGFTFDCPEFLVEDEVKKELDAIPGDNDDVKSMIQFFKEEYLSRHDRSRDWSDFIDYVFKSLSN